MPASAVTVTANFETVTHVVETGHAPSLQAVYPNPTNDVVNLQFETASKHVITLTDLSGKVLLLQEVNDSMVRLDMSCYPAGVYLLIVVDGEQRSTTRVVKE